MHRYFFVAILTILFFSACTDESAGQDLVSKPPFDKITDSIRSEPNNAALYYKRGVLLYQQNHLAYAEQDVRKAWELQPDEQYALSLLTILKQKNTDEAIAFIQEALKKLPNSIALQIGLARGFQQKRDYDQSLEICDRLLSRYPGQLDALLLKAEILKEQNKTAESIQTLETAYQFAPGDVELVHNLAFEYAESKNPKVLPLADSLIAADVQKTHAEPYYFKGVYFSNIGNYQQAVKQFDQAILTNRNFMDAHINKGIVFYDQGKYDLALQVFSLAQRAFPDEAYPYYWLGKTQQAVGDKTEAKANYLRAYGLDKTMQNAKDSADKL